MYCFADDMYFGDRDDKYKKWKNGEYDEGWEQGPWENAIPVSIKLQFLYII